MRYLLCGHRHSSYPIERGGGGERGERDGLRDGGRGVRKKKSTAIWKGFLRHKSPLHFIPPPHDVCGPPGVWDTSMPPLMSHTEGSSCHGSGGFLIEKRLQIIIVIINVNILLLVLEYSDISAFIFAFQIIFFILCFVCPLVWLNVLIKVAAGGGGVAPQVLVNSLLLNGC